MLSLINNTVAQDGKFGHGFVLHLSNNVFKMIRGEDCGLHVYTTLPYFNTKISRG